MLVPSYTSQNLTELVAEIVEIMKVQAKHKNINLINGVGTGTTQC
jgi:hypothetical protein